jgi:hypothetical protein
MKRNVRFAGTWYPKDCKRLEELISFKTEENGSLFLGVVPHAGLFYSASLIKLFFSQLSPSVTRVILITPSHYFALPPDCIGGGTLSSFDSTLGDIEGFSLPFVDSGYEEVTCAEHAVEMFLPFLSFRGNTKLCCLHINRFTHPYRATQYAHKFLTLMDGHTAFVASSDFTHYGSSFGYIPYGRHITPSVVQRVTHYDRGMAQRFVAGDGLAAYERATKEDRSTICGIAPLLVVSEMARLASMEGEILGTANSLSPDSCENNFVSYITLGWRKKNHDWYR